MKNLIWSSFIHRITTDKGENMKNSVLCMVFLFMVSSHFYVEKASLGCCMQEPVHTGDLEVFVLHAKGKEMPDAHVFIDNIYRGKTDTDGKLIIKGLYPQKYTIRVEAEGYPSKEKIVNVEQGTTTVVVFEMGTTFIDIHFYETAFGLGVFILILVLVGILVYFVLKMYIKLKKSRTVRGRTLKKPQVSYCPLCKSKIQDDWTVCPHCGATLTGTLDDKTHVY